MITLSWQQYADWLISTEGMDTEDAITRAGALYRKQHGKELTNEDIRDFHDNQFKSHLKTIEEIESAIDSRKKQKRIQKEHRGRNAQR